MNPNPTPVRLFMTDNGWHEIQPTIEALQQEIAALDNKTEVYVRDVELTNVEPPDRILVCVIFEVV